MCETCLRDHSKSHFTQRLVMVYRRMRCKPQAPGIRDLVPYLLRQILTTCSPRAVSAMSLGFHGNASFIDYCNVTLPVYLTILYGNARAFYRLASVKKKESCKAVVNWRKGNLSLHCLNDATKTWMKHWRKKTGSKISQVVSMAILWKEVRMVKESESKFLKK